MIPAETLRTGWNLLEVSGLSASGLRVRPVNPEEGGGEPPLLGIDDKGYRLLLFPVTATARVVEDRISSGIQVVELKLAHQEQERRFVVVSCRKSHLEELFSIIAGEMLEAAAARADRPDLACRQVLGHWRELLERERGSGLSEEGLVAVLGELICLRDVLRQNPGAIHSWTGPLRERHDFAAKGISLEVKTSRSREGLRISIHGVDQLAAPVGGRLFLTVLRIEQVSEEGETLSDLVADIRAFGADTFELMRRLGMVGIDAAALHNLADHRFVLRERRMYAVNEQFPRITSESFLEGRLPAGIVSIDYVIDLTGESPAQLPEQQSSEIFELLAFGVRDGPTGPAI